MKRLLLIILSTLILMFASLSISYSQYTTIQITNNNDYHAQINDNGYVVCQGYAPGRPEIFLYDGISTTQLTNNAYWDREPQINNDGDVVWRGSDGSDDEIFLYDGVGTTQFTNNAYDDLSPQINNNGDVVWQGCDGSDCYSGDGDFEIFVYDGISTTQLTNNAYWDREPQINNDGDVVWRGCDGADCAAGDGDYEIFLYDGVSTTQLTNNAYDDLSPQINNNGDVVWYGCDTTDCTFTGDGDWETFLYDGTSTTQLTDNTYSDSNPQINNNGYVVWGGGGIWLYDGSATAQIAASGGLPQINDNGEVVWYGDDGSDYEIFVYDGATTTQLTNNSYVDQRPQINNNGYVVWEGNPPGSYFGIFLAIPCSFNDDYDGDGYVSASCGGDDCNDSNPNIYPTNENTYCDCEDPYPQGTDETCGDVVDNDCNGIPDDKDQDGDGYIDEGCGGDDCNDSYPNIYPTNENTYCDCENPYPQGTLEVCSGGVDEDCDGWIDDDDPQCLWYSSTAKAEASTYGGSSVSASGSFNALVLLLVPVGAVVLLRLLRRKR